MSAIAPHSASTRLILCEKSGRWAAWLRRLAGGEARWIVETRSLPQLRRELGEHPASLCGMEATRRNVGQVVQSIARIRDDFPAAGIVVLCDNETAAYEAVIREAGAAQVIASPRQVDPLHRIWRRHCRQHPPAEETLMDNILAKAGRFPQNRQPNS